MQVHSNQNISTQDDSAFKALVESQRELLSQMRYEGNPRQRPPLVNTALPFHPSWTYGWNAANWGSREFERIVVDRRSSIDAFFPSISKRMSGVGNDLYVLPQLNHDSLDWSMRPSTPTKDFSEDKMKVIRCPEPIKSKKRRLSSLGLLPTTFFEDIACDESLKPTLPDLSERSELELDLVSIEGMDQSTSDDDEQVTDNGVHDDEQEAQSTVEVEEEQPDDVAEPMDEVPPIDPEEMRLKIKAFRAAMEKSQQSQQSIHDWDRKMGLKRSHSKTMRLSSRSRKKLRTSFQREFGSIS